MDNLERPRAEALSPEVVSNYFDLLDKTLMDTLVSEFTFFRLPTENCGRQSEIHHLGLLQVSGVSLPLILVACRKLSSPWPWPCSSVEYCMILLPANFILSVLFYTYERISMWYRGTQMHQEEVCKGEKRHNKNILNTDI